MPGAAETAVRIIPARAGFTSCFVVRVLISWDHPRSRGVYATSVSPAPTTSGSSPLARGLPGPVGLLGADPRIIPARAGFTRTGNRAGNTGRDHPRSRGVYMPTIPTRPRTWGSSPLARGLRGDQEAHGEDPGIIPARAGFTTRAAGPSRASGDHPRSRGVYAVAGPVPSLPPRIIPARAGFTSPEGSSTGGPWDHPRSRGVYRRCTP